MEEQATSPREFPPRSNGSRPPVHGGAREIGSTDMTLVIVTSAPARSMGGGGGVDNGGLKSDGWFPFF